MPGARLKGKKISYFFEFVNCKLNVKLASKINLTLLYEIIDAEKLEAVIKAKVVPYNFVESTMSFNLNAKGKIYQYISGNDWDSNWFPGKYNMTASVQPIKIDTSNPR